MKENKSFGRNRPYAPTTNRRNSFNQISSYRKEEKKRKRVGAFLLSYSIHPRGRIRIDITHQHPLCIIE